MRISTVEIRKYIADDGAVFYNEEDCEKYEKIVWNYYLVTAGPDLTEGRGYYKSHLIKVAGYKDIALCKVQDWCFKTYGSPLAYVQGVSEIPNWIISETTPLLYQRGTSTSVGDYRYESTQITL